MTGGRSPRFMTGDLKVSVYHRRVTIGGNHRRVTIGG